MGFGGSANIFQAQIMDLMASLEFEFVLIITRRTLDKHLQKMETVLTRLRDAGLKVNAAKSLFVVGRLDMYRTKVLMYRTMVDQGQTLDV
jgi:hypothetical protein